MAATACRRAGAPARPARFPASAPTDRPGVSVFMPAAHSTVWVAMVSSRPPVVGAPPVVMQDHCALHDINIDHVTHQDPGVAITLEHRAQRGADITRRQAPRGLRLHSLARHVCNKPGPPGHRWAWLRQAVAWSHVLIQHVVLPRRGTMPARHRRCRGARCLVRPASRPVAT